MRRVAVRQVVRARASVLLSLAAAIAVAGAGCGLPPRSPGAPRSPATRHVDADGVPDASDGRGSGSGDRRSSRDDGDDGGEKPTGDRRIGDPEDGGSGKPQYRPPVSKDGNAQPEPSQPDDGTLTWPPPDPSAIAEIEARYFAGDRTLWDAAERIRGMLVRRGYQDLGWYRTGTGFAVATRCERIDDRGIPLGEPRFSTAIPRFHDFSLSGIARALFAAPRGRFRVIVIAVTSDPGAIHRRTDTIDATAVEALNAGGNAPIPRTLDRVSLAQHAALILFYEIAKLGDASPRIVADGLTSADHLRGSGLEIW